MNLLIYIYIFIVGACLGSFFNVVGLRLSEGKSIIKPGSTCPKCDHRLSAWELIPIISYLILVGKCRKCKSQISIKYTIFELLTGLLFVYSYYLLGFTPELIVALTFISLFIIISVSDLAYMVIEDKVIIFFLLVLIIERLFILLPYEFATFSIPPTLESFLGGLFGFGLLYWIAYIGQRVYNKEVMGGGDIKLFGVIGLVLGLKYTLVALFFASMVATIVGFMLIGFKLIKRDTPIPFGPFIGIGSLITYFYGPNLVYWYFNLF